MLSPEMLSPENAAFMRRWSESAATDNKRALDTLRAYIWRDLPDDDKPVNRAFDEACQALASAQNAINLLNRRLRERENEAL